MVKKNYKGNMEAYKKHSEIPTFYEENTEIEFNVENETEKELAASVAQNPESQLSYLKLERLEDGQFKIGEEDPLTTDFFILN